MEKKSTQVRQQLLVVEASLKKLDKWEEAPPSVAALSSKLPFCYDTLSLEQWLQWIFLPSLHTSIKENLPLPTQCDIASYAELVYQSQPVEMADLIQSLRDIDDILRSAV